MRPLLIALGALMILAGALWTGQGLGWFGDGSTTGGTLWAAIGPAVAGLGVALVWVVTTGSRRR